MKNLWSIIKRHVKKRKATNIEELNKILHEEWAKIDVRVLNYLINPMKSRCLELIKLKGENY